MAAPEDRRTHCSEKHEEAHNTPAKTDHVLGIQTYKTPTGRPHLMQFGGLHSTRSVTPVRSTNNSNSASSRGMTPGSQQCTPSGFHTPRAFYTRKFTSSSMAKDLPLQLTPKYMTPKGKLVYNPFEAGLLDTLGQPLLSPNVFAKTSTPNSDKVSLLR